MLLLISGSTSTQRSDLTWTYNITAHDGTVMSGTFLGGYEEFQKFIHATPTFVRQECAKLEILVSSPPARGKPN